MNLYLFKRWKIEVLRMGAKKNRISKEGALDE